MKKLVLDSISFNRTLNDKTLNFKVQTSADKIAEIDVSSQLYPHLIL